MQVRSKFDDPTGKVTETGQSVFSPQSIYQVTLDPTRPIRL